MMNIKNTLLQVFKDLNSRIEAINFEMVTSVDGTEFNLSGREVGAEATIADSEPLKNGEYELTDGFKFIVKDGLIDSITEQVEKVEDAPVEEVKAEDEVAVEGDSKDEEITALKADVEALKGELEAIKSAIESLKVGESEKDQDFKTELQTLSANIKLLADIPMQQSQTNQSFKTNNKKSEDFERLRNAFSN